MCQVLCLVPSCTLFWGQWMTICDTHNSSDVMLLWKGAVIFIFFLGPLEPLKKVGSRNTGTYLTSVLFCSPHPSSSAAEERAELTGDAGIMESKSIRREMSAGVFRELKNQGLSFFSQGSTLVVRGSDGVLLGLLLWQHYSALNCSSFRQNMVTDTFSHSFPENGILLQMNKLFLLFFQNFESFTRIILWWVLVILSNNSTYLTKLKRI